MDQKLKHAGKFQSGLFILKFELGRRVEIANQWFDCFGLQE